VPARLPPPPGLPARQPPPVPDVAAATIVDARPVIAPVDGAPIPSWVNAPTDGPLPELQFDHRPRGLLAAGCAVVVLVVAAGWIWHSKGHDPARATHVDAAPLRGPASHGPAAADLTVFERERAAALHLFQAGNFAAAAAAYERATKLDPAHAGSFAGLGAARALDGDLPGAIAAYREAVRLLPEHSGFRAALGRAYRQAGQRQLSQSEYQRALALDAHNEAARRALAELTLAPK
jgi:tetratricopeptide (TPR) repeat protein